jgi:hypothetical protein
MMKEIEQKLTLDQPATYRSTRNLPNQSAGTPRPELVGVGRRDDDHGRK